MAPATSNEQQLFGQHDAQWITPGLPGHGDILLFNNGQARPSGNWTSIEQFTPPRNQNGNYSAIGSGSWAPNASNWSWSDGNFFAAIAGGCQRLKTGNTFITDSGNGMLFEVTTAGNIVWTWNNPYPPLSENELFKTPLDRRMLWPGDFTLSVSGGTAAVELLAGAQHAHQQFFVTTKIPGLPLTNKILFGQLDQSGQAVLQYKYHYLSASFIGREATLLAGVTTGGYRLLSKEIQVNFIQ